MITFELLAKMLADEFKQDMADHGFESFEDMRRSYDWDWAEIKEEINRMITSYANKAYDSGEYSYFFMFDDYSYVQIGVHDMPWKEFKKLLLAELAK